MKRTVTYVEMTSPDDLVPGKPSPLHLELVETTDRALVRRMHVEAGEPHGWEITTDDDERWARPDVRRWVATVEGEPAGLLVLRFADDGEREIEIIGLTPPFVGRGIGGDLLTRAVRLAWEGGGTRISLDTTTDDHPRALPNYLARGFRPFRVIEVR